MADGSERRDNRFERMPRGARIGLLLGFALFLVVAMDVGVYLLVYLASATGLTSGYTFSRYRGTFHPLLTGRPLRGVTLAKSPAELGGWQEFDPWYGYRNSAANTTGLYAADARGFIAGARTGRELIEKAPDAYRIFVLGGSTVAGHGLTNVEDTITAQLEKNLNAHRPAAFGKRFEVVNASVAGWWSVQELGLLEFEIVYLQPDLVISLDGYNDFWRCIQDGEGMANPLRYHWSTYQSGIKKWLEHPPPWRIRLPERLQVWRYSYLVDLVLLALEKRGLVHDPSQASERVAVEIRRRYPDVDGRSIGMVLREAPDLSAARWLEPDRLVGLPVRLRRDLVGHYANNVRFMKGVCDGAGVAFLGALQPLLTPRLKPALTTDERFYTEMTEQAAAQKGGNDFNRALDEARDLAAARMASSLGDSFLDLSTLFEATTNQVYLDLCHYNEPGSRRIAEALAGAVWRAIGVAPAPDDAAR